LTTEEVFREALDRGIDEVAKQKFAEPSIGETLVRVKRVKRDEGRVMALRPFSGVIPVNSDADTPEFATSGLGFSWSWRTYTFRRFIGFERKSIEIDDIGFTKGSQSDLLDMHKRTVEYVIADHFNRAFGLSGAPRLADDGCYYIDNDRPNPNPEAGRWSNREATADLTIDTLFTAVLNAQRQVSPDGNLYPQTVKKLMIPPAWQKKLWVILESENVPGSNYNDANWARGVFSHKDVIVYPYLEINAIFYWLCEPSSEDNELLLLIRRDPEVMTEWGLTGNPDVLVQRLRADWGLGLGSPRKSIRGGLLEAS